MSEECKLARARHIRQGSNYYIPTGSLYQYVAAPEYKLAYRSLFTNEDDIDADVHAYIAEHSLAIIITGSNVFATEIHKRTSESINFDAHFSSDNSRCSQLDSGADNIMEYFVKL
mmetsp:Transcript_7426/g.8442  ORF Transcript_7426/g.8442 Transcript_7426/m.8442 type:complete len:115 (+) Transcript_7426:557-901(+)